MPDNDVLELNAGLYWAPQQLGQLNPESFYYLCTPYSKYPKGEEQAYQDACRMTAFLEELGLFVFCPIVHSHGPCKYVSEENKRSYDFWLTIDFKFVRLAKGLIICKMDGWQDSYGINKEIKLALELYKPIIYTGFLEAPNVWG